MDILVLLSKSVYLEIMPSFTVDLNPLNIKPALSYYSSLNIINSFDDHTESIESDLKINNGNVI